MSLPVWRVDISPFACNLLDSVAVLPFSSKHYTLPIIAFSFVLIYWKCLAENAPKVETFFGEACPHIFLVCSTSLRRSSLSFRAYTFKTSRYAPVFDIEKNILLTKYPLFYHVRGKKVDSLLNKRFLMKKKKEKKGWIYWKFEKPISISFEYTSFTVKGFGSTKNHGISKFESVWMWSWRSLGDKNR